MTYRASKYVIRGIADEHAYNMFLSFEEICCRIGLWDNSVGWLACNKAFHRLTSNMPNMWGATKVDPVIKVNP